MHKKFKPESSNNLDSNKQNQAPVAKKQRRKKPEILKFRTKIWYQSVRNLTGKRDGDLDLEFGPKDEYGNPRAYVDRVRIFEELRKRSSSIIRGEKGKRGFDLVQEVAEKSGLEMTKEFYEMPFWACVVDRKPTIESLTNYMSQMVDALALHEKTINEDEIVDLNDYSNTFAPPPPISYKYDYGTYEYEVDKFEFLLNCLGTKSDYTYLLREFNLELLIRYFNNLTFNISFYRYAMLIGDFQATVAASKALQDMLSLLLDRLKGLDPIDTENLRVEIHKIVLKPNGDNKGKLYEVIKPKAKFDKNNHNLAINVLFSFM